MKYTTEVVIFLYNYTVYSYNGMDPRSDFRTVEAEDTVESCTWVTVRIEYAQNNSDIGTRWLP